MKLFHLTVSAAVYALGLVVASHAASFPTAYTLEAAANTTNNVVNVKISDASDCVWVLQGSSNLVNWTEVSAIKIHNGSFQQSFAPDAANPNQFFRMFYDYSRQTVLSSTDTALKLPVSNFNYAAPTLPANFLTQPILAGTMQLKKRHRSGTDWW